LKLHFNIKLEAPAEPQLNLSVDIPDKYGKIGLESAKLAAAIKEGIDKIKETLNEHRDDDSSKLP